MLLHTHEYKYRYKYTLQYLLIGVDIVVRVDTRLAFEMSTFQEVLQKWDVHISGEATIVNSHLVEVNHSITLNIYLTDLITISPNTIDKAFCSLFCTAS